MSGLTGKISQVIGPVVDVHFDIVDGKKVSDSDARHALQVLKIVKGELK